jgi:hypothetical protein
MYDLINFIPVLERASAFDLTLNRNLKQQKIAIDKIVNFYRTYIVPGPTDSPFVRLLYAMNYESTNNPGTYYYRFKQDEILPIYGFTGITHKGKVHTGFFYGETKTIIVSEPEATLADVMRTPWMDLQPLKVIKHPGLTHSLVRPDLADFKEGIAVIKVDLPMLGYMFGKWLEIQSSLEVTDREPPEHFLVRYVYPNMLYSQFRACMINSLSADITEIFDTDPNPTPVLTIDKTTECYTGLRDLIDKVSTDMTFDQFLKIIPDIEKESMILGYDVINIEENNYVFWAILTAAMPLLLALSQHCINNPELSSINPTYRRYKRKIKNQSLLSKIDDNDIEDYLRLSLQQLDLFFI